MKKKLLAALIAGSTLVGAALVASVISPATAEAHIGGAGVGRGGEILEQVLDDLVAEGTIDQDQADAVLGAIEDKADELREEREAMHELLQSLFEDGVMTSEEAEQLPSDHPLLSETFDEAWADGELTREEVSELRPHPRRNAFKKGARLGALLDDGGIDQAEYDSLGDDHPLKSIDVSEYLSDGLITVDELREIRSEFHQDGDDA